MTNGRSSSHISQAELRFVERTRPVAAKNASAIADRIDAPDSHAEQQAEPLVSIIINNYNYFAIFKCFNGFGYGVQHLSQISVQ